MAKSHLRVKEKSKDVAVAHQKTVGDVGDVMDVGDVGDVMDVRGVLGLMDVMGVIGVLQVPTVRKSFANCAVLVCVLAYDVLQYHLFIFIHILLSIVRIDIGKTFPKEFSEITVKFLFQRSTFSLSRIEIIEVRFLCKRKIQSNET